MPQLLRAVLWVFAAFAGVMLFTSALSASPAHAQETKLVASGEGVYEFGHSVALSADGTHALVGARFDDVNGNDEQGSAYIFALEPDGDYTWEAKLTASDGTVGDRFGRSVSLSADGERVLIGACYDNASGNRNQGSAYVFIRQSDGSYVEEAKLTAPDGGPRDRFGCSASLSADGSVALIGAYYDNTNGEHNQGSAYVFARQADGTYTQAAKLTASDGEESDYFGFSVALSADGQRALVGAVSHDLSGHDNQGSAYVFARQPDGSYAEEVKLVASDNAPSDQFGYSVALSSGGERALVGARHDDVDGNDQQGSVYVFAHQADGTYSQETKLVASDSRLFGFGYSVALSSGGERALVGAFHDEVNGNGGQGSAYVFARQADGTYSQETKLVASDGEEGDEFGYSVTLSSSGERALIGARHDDSDRGSAYVYGSESLAGEHALLRALTRSPIMRPGRPNRSEVILRNVGSGGADLDVAALTVLIPSHHEFEIATDAFIPLFPDTALVENDTTRLSYPDGATLDVPHDPHVVLTPAWTQVTLYARDLHAGSERVLPINVTPYGTGELPIVTRAVGYRSYEDFRDATAERFQEVEDRMLEHPDVLPGEFRERLQDGSWKRSNLSVVDEHFQDDNEDERETSISQYYEERGDVQKILEERRPQFCDSPTCIEQNPDQSFDVAERYWADVNRWLTGFKFAIGQAASNTTSKAVKRTRTATKWIFNGIKTAYENGDMVVEWFDQEVIRIVRSRDPNDIIGPAGYGAERWIAASEEHPLSYRIRFENDPEKASAPAQLIEITQPLDPGLDAERFRLGALQLAGRHFDVFEGQPRYTGRLDLRDTLGVYADVSAGLNEATGEAFWRLEAIDPETGGPPEDALVGLLPIGGQGSVRYAAPAKAALESGDTLRAQAKIVFDTNDPIETPVWSNGIDRAAPASRVRPLGSEQPARFEVTWGGRDSGSGVRDYSVYVSRRGADPEPWLEYTSDTTAVFEGTVGTTYAFYSLARDSLGHTEAVPEVPDAQTTVARDVPERFRLRGSFPNPFRRRATIRYELPEAVEVRLVVYDVLGRRVAVLVGGERQEAGSKKIPFEADGLASGVYFYRLEAGDYMETRKAVLVR